MAKHPIDILGPDVATGGFAPELNLGALGSGLPNELSAAGLAGDSALPSTSTLDIDPNSFVTPEAQLTDALRTDIDLAQPRVKPKTTAEKTAANERAAAIGGVAGTAITEGVSIWSNVETLKAEDKIFMDKIQRGFETLEFNQRMIRNASNMAALNKSLNAIDALNKQGGDILAGGQGQLFSRSPNTGRLV